jgi:DNA-binding NtrC family response regulator
MTKRNILIVDDEPTQCKILGRFVENMDCNYLIINRGMEVIDFFINKKTINGLICHDFDVMLLDVSMPDVDGISVLRQINQIMGDLQVIVLTASEDISLAITAIGLGAIDYITKNDKDIVARINASVHNAIEKKNLKYQVLNLLRKNKNQVSFSDIIGNSAEIDNALKLAKKIASSNVPVLIEGPSGSGKKLLASAIHGSSSRAGKPFVIVECDLLKPSAVEEEVFGSEKNINGTIVKTLGKIREANNGTIFFGKIDSLRLEIQMKILRFLQEGDFQPAGSSQFVRVNTRVIFSTRKTGIASSDYHKFREDLCFRISAFQIALPSLKERGNDEIKLLTENFYRNFSINENKKIRGIADDAMEMLYNFDWVDNIRQLKNQIFRAVVLCDGDLLELKHFPQVLSKMQSNTVKKKAKSKARVNINSELIDIYDENGHSKTMELIEEEIIARMVKIYKGNLTEVSKRLGVGRSTIYRKLKVNEIDFSSNNN